MNDQTLCIWLILTFWLGFAVIAFYQPHRRRFGPQGTEFSFGLGWLKVETEALNNLPTWLLIGAGVVDPSNSFGVRNPKSFDEDNWEPPELARPRANQSRTLINAKRRIFKATYDLGAIISVFGVIAALLVLLHLSFRLFVLMWQSAFTNSYGHSNARVGPLKSPAILNAAKRLLKRARIATVENIDSTSASYSPPSEEPSGFGPGSQFEGISLQLAIPGVTIPFSHLPVFLSALITSQTIHEFGHALAAALNSVSLESVGFYLLFPFIPVCYVKTMPIKGKSFTMDSHQVVQIKKLRIASAGVWHNIVLALLGWMAWSGGCDFFGLTMKHTVWKDIGQSGVMVASVSKESPLEALLKPRDIITKVDDNSLSEDDNISHIYRESFKASSQKWDEYLLQSDQANRIRNGHRKKGWCISKAQFQTLASTCCESPFANEHTAGLLRKRNLCFRTNTWNGERRNGCLETAEVTNLMNHRRCQVDENCHGDAVCIEPDRREKLMRIHVVDHSTGASKTVFYQGPRYSLWDAVHITHLSPRFAFIPVDLILIIQGFLSYLVSLSIGLGFMNLLPIRCLDGSSICESFVAFISSPPDDDEHYSRDEVDLDMHSIGHARPTSSEAKNSTKEQVEQSLLYLYLILVIRFFQTVLGYPKTRRNSSALHYTGRLREDENIDAGRRRFMYFLQITTTLFSSIVFVGLFIQSF